MRWISTNWSSIPGLQGPCNVPTFVGGSGSYVIDVDGRRYLDFSSQLVFTNLGYQHPRIVAAIKEQADRLYVRLHPPMRPMSVAKRRG